MYGLKSSLKNLLATVEYGNLFIYIITVTFFEIGKNSTR